MLLYIKEKGLKLNLNTGNNFDIKKIGASLLILILAGIFSFIWKLNSSDSLQTYNDIDFKDRLISTINIVSDNRKIQDKRYIELIKIATETQSNVKTIKEQINKLCERESRLNGFLITKD